MDKPPKSNFEKEPEIIEVSQYEVWKLIKRGDVGVAAGLGVCFGIIFYDPETKDAVIGHLVSPSSTSDLHTVISEAKKLSKNPSAIKVYVGGNTLESIHAPDFKEDFENRRLVESELREAGFTIEKIEYASSIETTEMKIDTRTGIVEYEQYGDMEEEWGQRDDE